MKRFDHPFTHWVDREFLLPTVVEQINDQWPVNGWRKEEGKAQRKWHQPALVGAAGHLMLTLTSRQFLDYLQRLTGIEGLVSDPEQFGGGLHSVPPGGFLRVHTDFQYLPNGYRRRLNLLVYLNEEWPPHWRGELELHGKEHIKRILPHAGLGVLFPTTKKTWHGHPLPTRAPVHRRSLAVYYYTPDNGEHDKTVYR